MMRHAMPPLLLLLPLVLVLPRAGADAQTTAPTAAEAGAVDLASPKSAAKSLYEAAERGDAEAIRQVFFTETEAQRALADAYAEMIVAAKRLADVAHGKFGGAADAFAQGAVPAEELKRIDAAEVNMDGPDRASIQLPLSPRPMNFRRTAEGWRLSIADFAGAAPEKIDAQISLTRDVTAVMREIADGIDADKFADAHEAEQAIQQQMNEVMTRAVKLNPPATNPATAPLVPSPRTPGEG